MRISEINNQVRNIINFRESNASLDQGENWLNQVIRADYIDLPLVEALIEKGVNPNIMDLADEKSPLHVAVENSRLDVIASLLKKDANPNMASKKPSNRYIETLTEALIEAGEEVPIWPGDTPLHTACRFAHIKIIALLLQKGANPNIPNHSNERPLRTMLEARSNPHYLSGIRVLLASGANPQAIEGYYALTLQNELQEAREVSPLLVASGFNCTYLLTDPLKEEVKYLHHQIESLLKETLSSQEISIRILRALPRTLHFLKQIAGPYPQLMKQATLKEKAQYQQDMTHFNDRLHPTLKQRQEYASTNEYEKAIRHFLYIRHIEGAIRSSCLKSLGSMPHEILLQIKEHLMDQTFGALLSAPYQISREEALLLFKACQQKFRFWHHFNTERLEHDWRTPYPKDLSNDSIRP